MVLYMDVIPMHLALITKGITNVTVNQDILEMELIALVRRGDIPFINIISLSNDEL